MEVNDWINNISQNLVKSVTLSDKYGYVYGKSICKTCEICGIHFNCNDLDMIWINYNHECLTNCKSKCFSKCKCFDCSKIICKICNIDIFGCFSKKHKVCKKKIIKLLPYPTDISKLIISFVYDLKYVK